MGCRRASNVAMTNMRRGRDRLLLIATPTKRNRNLHSLHREDQWPRMFSRASAGRQVKVIFDRVVFRRGARLDDFARAVGRGDQLLPKTIDPKPVECRVGELCRQHDGCVCPNNA